MGLGLGLGLGLGPCLIRVPRDLLFDGLELEGQVIRECPIESCAGMGLELEPRLIGKP